jgi:hypothetical protein
LLLVLCAIEAHSTTIDDKRLYQSLHA